MATPLSFQDWYTQNNPGTVSANGGIAPVQAQPGTASYTAYNNYLTQQSASQAAPTPASPNPGTNSSTAPTASATSTTPASTGTPISQYMSNQVQNPTLPTGATVTPSLMSNTPDTTQGNETGIQAADTPPITASQVQAQSVDPNTVLQNFNQQAGQYQATLIGNNSAQGTAAQGTVNANDTVQGQLNNLYAQTTNGQTPTWAQGAVSAANAAMAQRGITSSSIGATAITAAVQNSAIQIASADAATYFSMDTQNLSNQQQAALQNTQNRQQSLLSDQAASNVASQSNAANAQQTQQFMASMVNSIMTNNASMAQAASQYNASETDQVSQYNDTLAYNRAQFNQQMQFAVDQSNTLWQRTIATQNTADVNAANQINATNTLNVSNTALNNLWTQFMDTASWAFTASQNQAQINANMAMAANNQNFALQYGQNNTLLGAAGALVTSLFSTGGGNSTNVQG